MPESTRGATAAAGPALARDRGPTARPRGRHIGPGRPDIPACSADGGGEPCRHPSKSKARASLRPRKTRLPPAPRRPATPPRVSDWKPRPPSSGHSGSKLNRLIQSPTPMARQIGQSVTRYSPSDAKAAPSPQMGPARPTCASSIGFAGLCCANHGAQAGDKTSRAGADAAAPQGRDVAPHPRERRSPSTSPNANFQAPQAVQ